MQTLPGLEVVRAVSAKALVRALEGQEAELLEVRFSPFDVWYEIDSFWEGKFLERTRKGAFAKTISERRDQIRCLFNHGWDPQVGEKVLGDITDLREDDDTAVGEVGMFSTSYNADLLPGLRAGSYGSSMRFQVLKDEWDDEPDPSDYNPRALPERTITEVRLFEFGPVTFPANPAATAGMRSTTDDYMERLRSSDPQRVAALTRARDQLRTPPDAAAGSATAALTGAAGGTPDEPGSSHSGLSFAQRERLIILKTKGA